MMIQAIRTVRFGNTQPVPQPDPKKDPKDTRKPLPFQTHKGKQNES